LSRTYLAHHELESKFIIIIIIIIIIIVIIMQERNPEALLQPFMTTLAAKGLGFQQALFVPPESSYRRLGSTEQHNDLSWQHGLQHVYQTNLSNSPKGVSCLLDQPIK